MTSPSETTSKFLESVPTPVSQQRIQAGVSLWTRAHLQIGIPWTVDFSTPVGGAVCGLVRSVPGCAISHKGRRV